MLFFDDFDLYLLVAIFLTCFQQLAVNGYTITLDVGQQFPDRRNVFFPLRDLEENEYGDFDEDVNNQYSIMWSVGYLMYGLSVYPRIHCVATAISPSRLVTTAMCVNTQESSRNQPEEDVDWFVFKRWDQKYEVIIEHLGATHYDTNEDKLNYDIAYLVLHQRVMATFVDFVDLGPNIYFNNPEYLILYNPVIVTVLTYRDENGHEYPEQLVDVEPVGQIQKPSRALGAAFQCLDPYIICPTLQIGQTEYVGGSPLLVNGQLYAIASFASFNGSIPQLFKIVPVCIDYVK